PSSLLLWQPTARVIASLSLHDALPIYVAGVLQCPFDRLGRDLVEDHAFDRDLRFEHLEQVPGDGLSLTVLIRCQIEFVGVLAQTDRKSTRLNSSHVSISYAVFCLKKNG